MSDLIKIRDISLKYDVSARTLRYYEDMGLIKSIRNDEYAYRMYDENAIKRLEQILILRKLNISVKDIQRIFDAKGSEAVLEVLSKKVDDIDDEVALLHELKAVVLEFIEQIKRFDFHKDSDIKQLYEKAKEIEQLANVEYQGNPSPVLKLMDVSARLKKAPDVRIVELPACNMASSGCHKDFEGLQTFDAWWSEVDKHRRDKFFPRDFMWFDAEHQGLVWYYAMEEGASDAGGFELVPFEGGLFAAAVSKDGDDEDGQRVHEGVKSWVEDTGYFALDETSHRHTMFHVITSPVAGKAMGYSQLEIYVPIKLK